MFDETFRACFADTPFGVALHQRIRFQVYRLDKGYAFPEKKGKDANVFSTANETDAWDDRSAHFVIQNKKTQQWVAATRLVLPRADGNLPVDVIHAFDRSLLDDPNMAIGEISRFCIIGNRSKIVSDEAGEDSLESWGIGPVGKHQQFEVTVGMMRAAGIFALKRKIDCCVLMITDAFARLLRTLGVKLQQVGPPTEYLGMRTAYLVNMRDTVMAMSQRSSKFRALFRRSKHAYVRISGVDSDTIDTVSEYAPDHSLFNETLFRETVLLPAENDPSLRKERRS